MREKVVEVTINFNFDKRKEAKFWHREKRSKIVLKREEKQYV